MLGWDADFATEAYRQEVEALAQHQVHSTNSRLDTHLRCFISLLIYLYFL